jgi:CDP-diacylglycerol---glycerol-3-phosphate 3-phosphatidyltransferase
LIRSVDVACSCVVLGVAAIVYVLYTTRRGEDRGQDPHRSSLPRHACSAALWALAPIVRATIALGISPNAITGASLVTGMLAGVFLGYGSFGIAGLLFVAASCGDALDGLVARAAGAESVGGALFDASVDRYEEFFAFGGLAIFFRSSLVVLTLTLAALVGSLMVSYGSAQAEVRRVAVPPGSMRRPERAVCLAIGTTLVPIVGVLGGPPWVREAPIVLVIAVIAVVANVSAVKRLRAVAAAVARSGSAPAPHPAIANANAR